MKNSIGRTGVLLAMLVVASTGVASAQKTHKTVFDVAKDLQNKPTAGTVIALDGLTVKFGNNNDTTNKKWWRSKANHTLNDNTYGSEATSYVWYYQFTKYLYSKKVATTDAEKTGKDAKGAQDFDGVNKNVYGNKEYVEALPVAGTFYTLTPKHDGELTVAFFLNTNDSKLDIATTADDADHPVFLVDNAQISSVSYISKKGNQKTKPGYAVVEKYSVNDQTSTGKGKHADKGNEHEFIDIPLTAGKTYYLFHNKGDLGLFGLVYTYTDNTGASTTLEWSEETNNTIEAQENVNVKITRTFVPDVWNTLCLPFDLSSTEVTTYFGSDAKLAEYSDFDGTTKTMTFVAPADGSIRAGRPYLLKLSAEKSNITFNDVNVIKSGTERTQTFYTGTGVEEDDVYGEAYSFGGTYNPKTLNIGSQYFLLNNHITRPADGQNKMKGFRAYFELPSTTTQAKASVLGEDIIIDSTTGIGEIRKDADTDTAIYNLSGQRVSVPLHPGIYIKGGRKFIVR